MTENKYNIHDKLFLEEIDELVMQLPTSANRILRAYFQWKKASVIARALGNKDVNEQTYCSTEALLQVGSEIGAIQAR